MSPPPGREKKKKKIMFKLIREKKRKKRLVKQDGKSLLLCSLKRVKIQETRSSHCSQKPVQMSTFKQATALWANLLMKSSTNSLEPVKAYSSAAQLAKIMVRRGLHPSFFTFSPRTAYQRKNLLRTHLRYFLFPNCKFYNSFNDMSTWLNAGRKLWNALMLSLQV